MATKYLENVFESFDPENEFSPFENYTPQDYLSDPVIQNLLKQQEKINRFNDFCNPGISFAFYQ
jgi:hypothetical protein